MRSFTVLVALMVFGAVFFLFKPSFAYMTLQKYAKQLKNANCSEQSTPYKNGCALYFGYRLQTNRPPDEALPKCKSNCVNVYPSPTLATACQAACQAMRDGE